MDKMITFACSCIVDGKQRAFNIEATSWEAAERVLKAIGRNGQVDGELVGEGYVHGEGGRQ